ncbi:competence protein CoiA family protein [Anaeromicropila populeti]|uniref:Competence protein CoiA-like family protein n=1 Tax=Anaeromicropila populeti TaxID=37658 RepID=A0A1I6IE10_9FIRM|nr:competence protein CoiA family protein [Anaeromicropila populeti]SFR65005.1 Competence protein CoiA-like family protein [Anaeromicropila populeti]
MVINESAYYNGKLWCAYELKDTRGNYKEEYRLFMRKESQKNKFICPDCGERLILCAGLIMEPFFKHHENSACINRSEAGNRRNIAARRMLFHLAKSSFPEAVIEFNKKIQDKITVDLLVTTNGGGQLALEYLSYEIKLEEWEHKHECYQKNNIIDIWFLNSKRYQMEKPTTFEYMMTKYKSVLNFIDYENNLIILKEKCQLSVHKETRLLAKEYCIEELQLSEQGEWICDYEEFKEMELSAMTALLERQEREKRFKQAQEEKKAQARQEYEEATRKRMESDNPVPQQFSLFKKGSVIRTKIEEGTVTKYTMKMTGIKELWDLPELVGKDWEVRVGDKNRFQYLRNLNKDLRECKDSKEISEKIQRAVDILESATDASQWR